MFKYSLSSGYKTFFISFWRNVSYSDLLRLVSFIGVSRGFSRLLFFSLYQTGRHAFVWDNRTLHYFSPFSNPSSYLCSFFLFRHYSYDYSKIYHCTRVSNCLLINERWEACAREEVSEIKSDPFEQSNQDLLFPLSWWDWSESSTRQLFDAKGNTVVQVVKCQKENE